MGRSWSSQVNVKHRRPFSLFIFFLQHLSFTPTLGLSLSRCDARIFFFDSFLLLPTGSQPCIVVSTAAVAKELFQTNDATFSSRPKRVFFSIINGNDDYKNLSAAPYGPHWRRLRKFYNLELFSPKRVASYQQHRAEEVHHMMKVLIAQANKGHEVRIREWASGVIGNIMTRMLINKR